jgi:hypothetical protein
LDLGDLNTCSSLETPDKAGVLKAVELAELALQICQQRRLSDGLSGRLRNQLPGFMETAVNLHLLP